MCLYTQHFIKESIPLINRGKIVRRFIYINEIGSHHSASGSVRLWFRTESGEQHRACTLECSGLYKIGRGVWVLQASQRVLRSVKSVLYVTLAPREPSRDQGKYRRALSHCSQRFPQKLMSNRLWVHNRPSRLSRSNQIQGCLSTGK